MPTLDQSLNPTGVDKMTPVEKSTSLWTPPAPEVLGPSMFGRGPVPGIWSTPDNLRQFYKPGIPQYRSIAPTLQIGGSSAGASGPQGPAGATTVSLSSTAASSLRFVYDETPTGTINGVNDTFTLSRPPNPAASLVLTKNGQQLYAGTGFTLTGSTIVYAAAYIPVAGDSHRAAIYQY